MPTKYYKTPTDTFRDWKVSTVIWANHNVRSAITAMQNTTNTIFKEQSLVNVEPHVCFAIYNSYYFHGIFIKESYETVLKTRTDFVTQ